MFFGLSKGNIEKRNRLKRLYEELKENHTPIETIKEELEKEGFDSYNIFHLGSSHHELIDFLGITYEEYEQLWSVKWMC